MHTLTYFTAARYGINVQFVMRLLLLLLLLGHV
jgi:hypothetical protein